MTPVVKLRPQTCDATILPPLNETHMLLGATREDDMRSCSALASLGEAVRPKTFGFSPGG